jgi:rare lipoprotein A
MTGPRGLRSVFSVLVVAALIAALAGCAANGPPLPADDVTGSVTELPRSARGNPPFYEVFGRRYYVMQTSSGYRERGTASWYGRDFHGSTTSGGERYDMHGLTAAHKTLPIPTWVEVTNLNNGRRVIVRVNDRGPFVGKRIIDLSYRAAQDLDMIGPGTAPVEVRALGTPPDVSPQPEAVLAATSEDDGGLSVISDAVADTPRPSDRPFRQLYVQVGAFSDPGNAASLLTKLKGIGFANSFVDSAEQGASRLHRVRIGPLAGEAQFDRVTDELRAVGIRDSRMVLEP